MHFTCSQVKFQLKISTCKFVIICSIIQMIIILYLLKCLDSKLLITCLIIDGNRLKIERKGLQCFCQILGRRGPWCS
jgi:hypothetical protein